MPIKCIILLISSNTWISWVNAQLLCFYQGLSIERVKKLHIDFTDNQKYL